MSDQDSRQIHSNRIQKTLCAIRKQIKILRMRGFSKYDAIVDPDQAHRFAKKHAMDCGNPRCVVCGNDRKIWGDPTIQEKRMFQDVDRIKGEPKNDTDRS